MLDFVSLSIFANSIWIVFLVKCKLWIFYRWRVKRIRCCRLKFFLLNFVVRAHVIRGLVRIFTFELFNESYQHLIRFGAQQMFTAMRSTTLTIYSVRIWLRDLSKWSRKKKLCSLFNETLLISIERKIKKIKTFNQQVFMEFCRAEYETTEFEFRLHFKFQISQSLRINSSWVALTLRFSRNSQHETWMAQLANSKWNLDAHQWRRKRFYFGIIGDSSFSSCCYNYKHRRHEILKIASSYNHKHPRTYILTLWTDS